MTIFDLSCDVCGRPVAGPGTGVRFVYHPGLPELRDDAGLACHRCWAAITGTFGETAVPGQCSACGQPVTRRGSLHLRRFDHTRSWRLCLSHAVGFLNSLRTVEPKIDPAVFRFPALGGSGGRPPGQHSQGP